MKPKKSLILKAMAALLLGASLAPAQISSDLRPSAGPAENVAAVPAGHQRYIVVLNGVMNEELVRQLGVNVERSVSGRLVVTMPPALREAVASLPGVKFMQHVGAADAPDTPDINGQSAAPVPAAAKDRSSGNHRVGAQSVAPSWETGDYAYDGSGNIYRIGVGKFYAYDTLSRLVAASFPTGAGTQTESYGYDVYGNLTAITTNGSTRAIAVDGASNHVGGSSYDANGDLVVDGALTLEYDSDGMVKRKLFAGGMEAYVYDANGERIGAGIGDDVTWSVRGLDGKVTRDYVGSIQDPGVAWLWMKDTLYRDGQLLAAEHPGAEGGVWHYHLDHLGTPRWVTADGGALVSQHDYTPWGIETTSMRQDTANGFSHEERMKFTGHERDFTSGTMIENTNYLDSMHARYYSAGVGRFLAVDPAMDLKKTMANPQMWNRYSYVVNNPIRFTDPDGREHVQEPGFTKPMTSENLAMDDSTPTVIKASFYIEGALATEAAAEFLGVARLYSAARTLFRRDNEPTIRADVKVSGGRSGQNVKNTTGPPNSVIRGSDGRVYQTNDKGQIINDITRDRVKPVNRGQGFGDKRPPTEQELNWLRKMEKAVEDLLRK